MSEKRLDMMFSPTHSRSSVRGEVTIREQLASITDLVENAAVPLFGDAGRRRNQVQTVS